MMYYILFYLAVAFIFFTKASDNYDVKTRWFISSIWIIWVFSVMMEGGLKEGLQDWFK